MKHCCLQTETLTNNNLDKRRMSAEPNSECELQITTTIRKHIQERVQIVYEFIESTLQIYKLEELIFCFNGGKDCTVLLDVLMRYLQQQNIDSRSIPMLYIESHDSFADIDEFVANCVQRYQVQLIKYQQPLMSALKHMTEDMPEIKAVFMGCRNTDPYCDKIKPMQPTDNGWPAMMRLNPLLEWSYHDIWHYIHIHNVPYCSLYDRGYTSIGHRNNTLPNPHLLFDSCANKDTPACYKPAWELVDATQERAGRQSK
ncbi:FAD synthase [Drosophila busckii]|nr:FAD synthase [Drosophila busckii]